MFADFKVVGLDPFLGVLNGLRQPRMFEHLPVLHAQFVHESHDAVRGEKAHQIIFQRDVKS